MAYAGYLIKIKAIEGGPAIASFDYVIPANKIIWESYKATYSTLDGDSKRSGTGRLKRKTYKHQVGHCSFSFKPMSNTELWDIWEMVKARYVKKRQKKVKASIWMPELNNYVEDYFYVPDIEFTIQKIENNKVLYAQTDVEFIGY